MSEEKDVDDELWSYINFDGGVAEDIAIQIAEEIKRACDELDLAVDTPPHDIAHRVVNMFFYDPNVPKKDRTVLREKKENRGLPKCPEPLGFKLWAQAMIVNAPENEGDRQKAIDAMRHTLRDIENYGLSKPADEVER